MDLKKYVLEVLSTEWTTTDQLAEMLSVKFPNEIMFEKDYGSNEKTLSKALGPTLYGLKNRGLVEDDLAKWPETKRWRRIEKEERTSLDVVIKALTLLGYAQNENQALRILALRAIRENVDDYKKIIEEAKKIEETKKKLLKTALGTRENAGNE
jgi:hypothetical protein